MAYTYILQCVDGTYYTGWTVDLVKRVKTHNAGLGGAYTRIRLPVQLVYWECKDTRQEAQRREWEIKQLKRAQKQALIDAFSLSIEKSREKSLMNQSS
ncbi:GIY-YIG nuclease family protein [Heliorestis convoluta]|uniref:GIY-YIG nuclease family protein n=1 Tax=Heliorestis convoluta TaxID=356322 RepID=A0A5Q2N1N5_9FIRM|nr:GIY-YIG nuclease family protein [Heliorestis convoluta]QGG47739.1 GIY-YIG nuclease family protein [Heliorestis convoluta]